MTTENLIPLGDLEREQRQDAETDPQVGIGKRVQRLDGDHQRHFELINFNDVVLPKTRRYLVKGLIPRHGLTVIWGPPKCGKSLFVFDLTMHVALGWNYRGRRVHPGPVAYVTCEGAEGFKARIAAFRQEKLPEEIEAVPFYLIADRLNLIEEHQVLISDIKAQLGVEQPVAVVLDTLNRSLAGSESSDQDMSAYVQAADAIWQKFDCAVIIVHHCGIDDKRPRGHTSLTGAADGQIAVKRDNDGNIAAKVEWLKDGQEGDEIFSRLEVVDVGEDDDKEPITSCIVVEADGATAAKSGKKIPEKARVALNLLRRAIHDMGDKPPGSTQIPSDKMACPVRVWRDYHNSGTTGTSDRPDSKRKAFDRAKDKLQVLEIINIWEGLVWICE